MLKGAVYMLVVRVYRVAASSMTVKKTIELKS